MNWAKIITLIVTAALIVGGGIWAYRIFEAPESIDAITAKWSAAGHADATAESFVHWNEDAPPEIPETCAKCHSVYGYLDYLGDDGTELRAVNNTAPIGSVLYCNTCHNETAHTLDSVVFPGGAEITGVGRWSNCLRCHQGRTSTETVSQAIDGLELDTVSEDLEFINVHYAIAAATQYGSEVGVGYEYEGRDYAGWYPHVEDYDTCIDCHDPHSTKIDPAACEPCHSGVTEYSDIFEIRGSTTDAGNNGAVEGGIFQDITTLNAALYTAIQAYASDVAGVPIVYSESFPYWGVDTNGNGEVDEGEVSFANQYNAWTPRLVRTTYNFHYVLQDPGGFTHNADYILQLIHDAIEDLSEQVAIEAPNYVRPDVTK